MVFVLKKMLFDESAEVVEYMSELLNCNISKIYAFL